MAREKRLIRECDKYNLIFDKNSISVPPFEVIIPPLYPFSPPKVYRFGKDVIVPLSKIFITNKSFIDKYNIKCECICCSSITCTWSPCNIIMDAVNEIQKCMEIHRTISRCIYLFPRLPFDDNIHSNIVQYLL